MEGRLHPKPWHQGSLFTDGPRRPLDRNARRLWLALADRARRAGQVTALHVEVGRALLRRLGVDGQLDPAHATLAADVGCGERTVRRALTALAGLGLLRWTRRLVRVGWRAEQTSNAYEVLTPDALPVAAKPRPACGGQVGRETPSIGSQSLPLFSPEAVEAAKKALQEVAAGSMARFLAAKAARNGPHTPRSPLAGQANPRTPGSPHQTPLTSFYGTPLKAL